MDCEGVEDEGRKWGVEDMDVDVVGEGVARKVDEGEYVGFGWTGPSCWRRALRPGFMSGSEASRFMSLLIAMRFSFG